MLSEIELENLLHIAAISNPARLLFCLALSPAHARQVADIREIAVQAGWTRAKKLNLSEYLKRANGLAILTPQGWKLTEAGQHHVALAAKAKRGPVAPLAEKLRAMVQQIRRADTRAFVEEAVRAFEASLYRSAIVLSWIGAVAVLYDHVVLQHLSSFNAEALRRDRTWRAASTSDDLARMKEYDFIQVLHAISVVGKSVKDELEGALKLRNGAGHPNSLRLGEHRTSGHVESLILNVYSRF